MSRASAPLTDAPPPEAEPRFAAPPGEVPQPLEFGVPASVLDRGPGEGPDRRWWASAAAALVLAGVSGWLAGGLLHRSPPAPSQGPHPRTIAAGALQVKVDGSWRPVATPPSLAVAGVRRVRAFAPIQGAPVTAWIGRASIADPTLLPGGLRDTLAGPLQRPVRTSIAGRVGWRYRQVALGGNLQDVTVVPTSAGSLLVGCSAPSAWSSSVDGCAGQVLDVTGAAPLEPRRDLALERRLPGIVAALNAERRTGHRALARAHRPRAQARAARRLAAAHARAAARVRPLLPAAGARPQGALRAVAHAYRRLGRTALAPERRRPARFRRARAEVRRAQARLERALR